MLRKKSLLLRLALLLALLVLTMGSIQAADATWHAKYWNNISLSGTPVLERDENKLDYDWGTGRPANGVNTDNWSAQWKRTVAFDTPGNYRFTATVDDGMRLWIDDVLVLDAWSDHDRATFEVDRYLTPGDHRLKVQYYEATGKAVARLRWRFVPVIPAVFSGWRGDYFDNPNLAGDPVFVRDDSQIGFDWQLNSPAPGIVPADNFSVRWTRTVPFSAGRYTFNVTVDDGVRLWVNNQLLIDRWQPQARTASAADITLPAGQIPIKMEFYDMGHHAVAYLSWTGSTGSTTISNWRGEYFNNDSLAGGPVAVRDDASIDFNWGWAVPIGGLGADNFSVRWTRSLTLPPGRYRFTTTTDDGVRLWVDNRLLIDRWVVHAGSQQLQRRD